MEASASEAAESAERSGSNVINIKVKTLGQAAYDLEVESDVSVTLLVSSSLWLFGNMRRIVA